MSKKIILFLSVLNENADEIVYTCPDGSKQKGKQTNEAPVKYLLHRYSGIDEIICIVTPEAQKDGWEYFTSVIHMENSAVCITPVFFERGSDFTECVIADILNKVSMKDEILLETTGGMRDSVMYLLLLSRVLSFAGVNTICSVYANKGERRIDDVTGMYSMFDLISGMQELSSFGAVQTLQNYYENQDKEVVIEHLLKASQELTEAITLCHTRQIDEKMHNFQQAVIEAETCKDTLIRTLLPAFREKFGNELTTPNLISWSVSNGMLQQALTVYTERIPAYLLGESGLLEVDRTKVRELKVRDYEDPDAKLFLDDFLGLDSGENEQIQKMKKILEEYSVIININKCAELRSMKTPRELKTAVYNLDELLKKYYPLGNLNKEAYKKKDDSDVIREIMKIYSRNTPNTKEAFIKSLLNDSGSIGRLLEMEECDLPSKKKGGAKSKIASIEKMKECIKGTAYTLNCSVEEMQIICRDYLYIKQLRNLTNHASSEANAEQEDLLRYLYTYAYQKVENVDSEQIRSALEAGIRHITETEKKRG